MMDVTVEDQRQPYIDVWTAFIGVHLRPVLFFVLCVSVVTLSGIEAADSGPVSGRRRAR